MQYPLSIIDQIFIEIESESFKIDKTVISKLSKEKNPFTFHFYHPEQDFEKFLNKKRGEILLAIKNKSVSFRSKESFEVYLNPLYNALLLTRIN